MLAVTAQAALYRDPAAAWPRVLLRARARGVPAVERARRALGRTDRAASQRHRPGSAMGA